MIERNKSLEKARESYNKRIKTIEAGLAPAQEIYVIDDVGALVAPCPESKEGFLPRKKQLAITLVALIITIIILLILATVSISLIINGGILDKAQHGVDKYSEEEELEQIKLAVSSAMLKGNGFLDTENLNSELQEKFGEDKEVIHNNEFYSFKLDKNYRIYKDGIIEEGPLLPDEYQQVEYIESSGTQWIDTKLDAYDKTTEVRYLADSQYNWLGNPIFGCSYNGKSIRYHCTLYSNKYYYATNTTERNSGSADYGVKHTIKYNTLDGYLVVDGIITDNMSYTPISGDIIYIGRRIAHNPKVVSSSLTPATKLISLQLSKL